MIPPGIYRHYKGKLYIVLGVAQCAENDMDPKAQVVYQTYAGGQLWYRSAESFIERVLPPGATASVQRFVRVDQ